MVIRSSGAPTYFASDMAYHHNKFLRRSFDTVINVWGADHQGHVTRLKTAVGAMGVDPDRLQIIITQMVTLKRGDELVKASKRSGDFVTLQELVEEVGADACRYFFLARAPSTQMDFDLELATKESSENPVYYVQYAYARICGILQRAQDQNLEWDEAQLSLLKDPHELTLIRKMLLLPELVEKVAHTLEPHHLPHYTLELATSFHWFYENCRVLSNDPADQGTNRRPPQTHRRRPRRPPPLPYPNGHDRPHPHVTPTLPLFPRRREPIPRPPHVMPNAAKRSRGISLPITDSSLSPSASP